MPKKANRKVVQRIRDRRLTTEEIARYRDVRKRVMDEFPPTTKPKLKPATSGIGAQIRAARLARGLTWYAVAKQAGVPNPATVRDIEYGRDAKLSNVEAVAEVLGLQIELVTGHRSG